MGFLDNSGDIILDAVLTDTGRMRLAKGDGSFRITQFALGDDEINYSLYNKNNPSGSAYYDLDILSTPVFEAFTNNISSLNSRLLTISRNNLLFLPVIKVNNKNPKNTFVRSDIVQNGYIMSADYNTQQNLLSDVNLSYNSTLLGSDGIINGYSPSNGFSIRLDQGIDNNQIPASMDLDPDLRETQYLIEFDKRFGDIVSVNGVQATPSYIDDDNIAAYYFSLGVDTEYIRLNTEKDTNVTTATNQVIAGARGTILEFSIAAGLEISSSPYLFNQLGTNETSFFTTTPSKTFNNIRSIMTSVAVTGLTTGYSIQIPILIFKYIS